MAILRAAIFAALFHFAWTGAAVSEDVTLKSRDGSVEISGNLLGYDGELYRVDTVYGVLTIDGSGVICDGPGCPDLGAFVAEFTMSGARTMGEVLMPALVEAFAARNGYRVERQVTDDTRFGYVLSELATGNPTARVGFHVTSSSEGFADLLANEADMVLSTRPASTTEIALAREAGLGDLGDPKRARIIALDAMVPVVSRTNALDGLTLQGLARVFSGQVDNWVALGGPDQRIELHLRDELSGVAQAFVSSVLTSRSMQLADDVTRYASDRDLSDAVARSAYGIGVVPYSALGNARALAIKGACGMLSVARPMSIKSEDYPLTLPLFIYTPARRLPLLARDFLAYARSPAAQPVISRAGFVDLSLRKTPVEQQGDRLVKAISGAGGEVTLTDLQRLVRRMAGTERLTLAFRFELGGTTLDPQSRSNVEILAAQLELGRFDDQPLVFVGFSDGQGPADANLRLALKRAEAVRRAVREAAPTADLDRISLSVDAFGEAMPLACDDAEWGREINRRVEVWVGQR